MLIDYTISRSMPLNRLRPNVRVRRLAGLLLVMAGLLGHVSLAWAVSYQTEASFYGVEACKVNRDPRCPTAEGSSLYDLERDDVLFAADWIHHFEERLKVTNVANGKSVEVVILDRGPNRRLVGRNLDLSKLAYSRIADLKTGVITVEVTEL